MTMARRKSSPGGSKRKFSLNPLVWLWRIFFWGFCAIVLLQLWYLAQIAVWTHVNPSSTSFMQTRLAEIRKTEPGFQLKHEWVPYDKISLNLKRAVIAAEDSGFMTHKGVEMEAMMACSVAALTIYDMCKSTDRSMTIGEVALWEKTGGRSGIWRREPNTNGSGTSSF